MALFGKIARFASSPAGRRAIAQAKRMANDPRTRQQAKDALDKVRRRVNDTRRGRGGGPTPPPAA
ncbi:hypothetical protein SAMN05421810_102162 [Amycolatopsis arida]|uniref:MT0933-like antitoxin protein n=1 Tax=Amycolatopsis arida TaxID=587909 RepID=A0A1I5P777_9PSEU|nr:hypothetical protein [Amycolatopsis arida]TDX98370.1 hypothetical protein CLV69_101162 [Amycolatopsis arida]SFP29351.1 hypothetical protein SAMN05421810_102162 [Amycolatopsis arida]